MDPPCIRNLLLHISFDLPILFLNRTFLNHDLFQCNNLHTKRTLSWLVPLVYKKIGPIIINLMNGRIVHVYIYYIITVRVPDLPILTF